MYTSIFTTFLILSSLGVPTGTTVDGPRSIRNFNPESIDSDTALRTYFEDAGPVAIEFYQHVSMLANPWLAGRQPGSVGSTRAGEYISWNFEKEIGREPCRERG